MSLRVCLARRGYPALPFQRLQSRRSRTPDLHISSSNRRGVGIWQGSDRMRLVSSRWLAGWSCDLIHLRGSLQPSRAFPNSRSCRYPQAMNHRVSGGDTGVKVSAWMQNVTYNFSIELLDFSRLLVRSPVIEVTHCRKS